MLESLLNAEKKLLEACQKGEVLDITNESNPNKQIRGEFLRWLILNNTKRVSIEGKKQTLYIDSSGIWFQGARIIGQFNISFCETNLPFVFLDSHFDQKIDLSNAKIRFLSLIGCTVSSIYAQRMICEGSVFLRDSFKTTGEIDFLAAQIKGNLDCSNGTFGNESAGVALNCNSTTIKGTVFLKDRFQATGKVDFGSAAIGSNFECTNGKFINENDDALNCNSAIIQGSVFLKDRFQATGKVDFGSATIGSNFECTNGKFTNEASDALGCNRATIQGSVFLKDIQVHGKVNFGASHIGSSFICSNGKFFNKNGDALICNRATIHGSVFLNNGFKSLGKIDFIGARIGSSFICSNGKFFNKNGDALNSDKATIQGSVFLNKQFKAIGKVNFNSTHIGNSFTCNNGKFIVKNGNALNCNSAKIQGNFILKNDFYAFGKVNLAATSLLTLSLSNLTIKGDLDLRSAKINTLHEDELFFQKKGFCKLFLDGLVYNHLNGENLDAQNRIVWLRKMPEFKPQPYKHLAKVLRTMGHHKDADAIMIEYNTILTHETKKPLNNLPINTKSLMLFLQLWCVLFIKKIYGKTAGYGYRPWNVFVTMLSVWLLCGVFYWIVAQVAVFAPSNPLIFQKKASYECKVNDNGTPILDIFSWGDYNSSNNWTANEKLEGEYTTFSPWWYSLDIILPIVDLQMDKDWGVFIPSEGFALNHITRWVIWFEILFGWIYSLILVAILSGLAKNEKD